MLFALKEGSSQGEQFKRLISEHVSAFNGLETLKSIDLKDPETWKRLSLAGLVVATSAAVGLQVDHSHALASDGFPGHSMDNHNLDLTRVPHAQIPDGGNSTILPSRFVDTTGMSCTVNQQCNPKIANSEDPWYVFGCRDSETHGIFHRSPNLGGNGSGGTGVCERVEPNP